MADQEKAVVFLCECGPIIKDLIDLDVLGEYSAALGDVGAVERYSTLCSPDGKVWLAEKIKEHAGMRPVFAACTPREHAEDLNAACEAAGLNPYLAGRANIREQCAWVTSDKAAATKKASHLVEAAVARTLRHEELVAPEIDCETGVLVVGTGVAGMTAALLLADAGRQVTVVEREAAIGGKTVLWGELFPDLDCAPCLLEPLMDRLLHHPNIEVLLQAEVDELLGYLGNYTARVRVKPRHVAIDGCYGCRTCASVCPVQVPDPVNDGMSTRTAVHIPYEGALPNASLIDESACLHFNGGECEACVAACAFGAISLDGEPEIVERAVGGIVIATGSELQTTGDIWSHPSVLSTYDFERVLNPDGPTGGEIRLPGSDVAPRTIALVHCAKADATGPAAACSRTCCNTLSKFAYEISHKLPDTQIVEFTFDRVLGGDNHRGMILGDKKPARLAEVRLGAGDDLVVTSNNGSGRVTCTRSGEKRFIDADIVVVAPPHVGTPSAIAMARALGVELDANGFVVSSNSQLRSYCGRMDGVYVAGSAERPKNVSEAASQGAAAAGAVLSALVPGRTLVREAATAVVNEDVCGGCGICVLTCPYKAISFNEETGRANVNELLCHGCGTCAAACPSAAIKAKHFTDDQLVAEITAPSTAECP